MLSQSLLELTSAEGVPTFPELEALLRLHEPLLHVSRLATIGELSDGIAHELNQPLCAVASYAQACDRLLAMLQVAPSEPLIGG